MPTNTQQCEAGSHLSQQDSHTSSPSPEGSSEPASGPNLSQRCACTNPPSKAQKACSAKLALLSATKGQELEPMRAMHQTPALGSVTATLQRAAFTPCQSKSSSCTLPLSVPCLVLRKPAVLNWANLFLFCMFSLGEGGQGEVGVNSTQYWNYCKQIEIFHVTHPGRNTPCKANSQKGLLKKRNRWFYTRINQQHFSSFTLAAAISHLLFCQSLLDFLVITDVINNRLGKLRLNPGQPGAKVTHVFVQ